MVALDVTDRMWLGALEAAEAKCDQLTREMNQAKQCSSEVSLLQAALTEEMTQREMAEITVGQQQAELNAQSSDLEQTRGLHRQLEASYAIKEKEIQSMQVELGGLQEQVASSGSVSPSDSVAAGAASRVY